MKDYAEKRLLSDKHFFGYKTPFDSERVARIESCDFARDLYTLPHGCHEQRIITPTEALYIVSYLNDFNVRKKMACNLSLLAEIIKNGNWQVTHQGIGFDQNGYLCDGQNRLHACVLADIPIRVNITYGMTKDEIAAIDQQRPRSSEVVAKTLGLSIGRNTLAIARAMMSGSRRRIDNRVLFDFVEKHADAIRFASRHNTSSKITSNANFCAAVARAYYHVDVDKHLDIFMQSVLTGNVLGNFDSYQTCPPCRLREWYATATSSGARPHPTEVFGRTQKAIKLFVDGIKTSKLVADHSELYPLPD